MSAAPATNNVTRYILIAIALLAVAAVLWHIADVFVIAFGGIVFAAVLHALVAPLQRVTGLSRRWALTLVVLGLLVLAALLGWMFGQQAANQFAEMRERLPGAAAEFQRWIGESRLGNMAIEALKQATQGEKAMASGAGVAGVVIGGLGNLLLILFAGIYFAANPALYRDGALRLLPPRQRPRVRRALDDAGVSLHKWLVAQIVVMLLVGILTGVGLAAFGVPLSFSLGLLAGLFEFVPVVGPIAAAIPGILIAFAVGPQAALYAAGVYIVVQQIESNVLTPLIQRWAVELPPVVALLAIVACGLLFGVMGVIFATPIAVVVMALVQHLYVEETLENNHPSGAKRARSARTTSRRPSPST